MAANTAIRMAAYLVHASSARSWCSVFSRPSCASSTLSTTEPASVVFPARSMREAAGIGKCRIRVRVDGAGLGKHIPSRMPAPFHLPEEATAAEAIAAIGDELAVFDDWMDRYQFIIDLGRKLPPFPPAWMDDAHRVPGCQSRVWMQA